MGGELSCIEHVEAVGEDLPLVDCTTMLVQTGVAVVISVLPCVAFYLAKTPNHFSFKVATSVALLFAASLTVCRTFLLERKHQVSAGCAFWQLACPCQFCVVSNLHASMRSNLLRLSSPETQLVLSASIIRATLPWCRTV